MNQLQKTILITGSNRGLGYAMVESLCKNNPLNLSIIMTARSQQKGQEVLQDLKKKYPSTNLEFLQLEIGNSSSHDQIVEQLKNQGRKIDILVNNAGIYYKQTQGLSDEQIIRETLNINYYGTVDFTKKILSQLTDNAKILMIGSLLGTHQFQSEYLIQKTKNDKITEQYLQKLGDEFVQCGIKNDYSQNSFLNQPYHVSKCLLQTWIKYIGQNLIKSNQNIFAIHPGWCQTDMGGKEASTTIEEGISYSIEIINNFPFERSERSGELYGFGKLIGQ